MKTKLPNQFRITFNNSNEEDETKENQIGEKKYR